MRVYLDSCIVIYLIESVSPWYQRISAGMAAMPQAVPCITDLVRMECMVKPLRAGNARILEEFEGYFVDTQSLPLTRAVFDRAAEFRAHHRLRTPDAIHIAAAIVHGCDELWTNDNRLTDITPELNVRIFGG